MSSQAKLIKIWALFLALAVLPPTARAGPLSQKQKKQTGTTAVDRAHQAIGEHARNLADHLDRYFSDEQIEEELQTSRVRLKPTLQWTEADNLDASMPFRIDLVLPRLKNKWKVLVSSFRDEDDDQIPNEVDYTDNDGEDKSGKDDTDIIDDDTSTFLGLQYTHLAREARHIKTSVGPKFRDDSVHLFASARLRFQYLTGPWTAHLTQYFFFDDQEFGERTSLDLQRPIGAKDVFRSASTVTYTETSKGAELGQTLLLRHFFSENRAAGASWQIAAHTRPSTVVDAYVAAIEYRQKMWRDWLYLDIRPQARFPREANFEFTPFLGACLEAIF